MKGGFREYYINDLCTTYAVVYWVTADGLASKLELARMDSPASELKPSEDGRASRRGRRRAS
jgi:hypothetical protein